MPSRRDCDGNVEERVSETKRQRNPSVVAARKTPKKRRGDIGENKMGERSVVIGRGSVNTDVETSSDESEQPVEGDINQRDREEVWQHQEKNVDTVLPRSVGDVASAADSELDASEESKKDIEIKHLRDKLLRSREFDARERELENIDKTTLGGLWSTNLFHTAKYVTEAMLDKTDDSGIFESVCKELKVETDKRKLKSKAIKKFIKHRIGRMRDYFVQNVKISVESARK
jgi:hypothetical protein